MHAVALYYPYTVALYTLMYGDWLSMQNLLIRDDCFFFLSTFFYLFSHTSQHNIHSKQTKHNKTTDVYSLFQKSNQKGEREGDKEKKK